MQAKNYSSHQHLADQPVVFNNHNQLQVHINKYVAYLAISVCQTTRFTGHRFLMDSELGPRYHLQQLFHGPISSYNNIL